MISPIFLGKKKDMNADILRQRRNLISTSIALSIYQLAGEKLEKGTSIFGTFKIANADIVIFLAWCSLGYFLWRFWMYTKSLSKFESKSPNGNLVCQSEEVYVGAFNLFLVNNSGYRKLAEKLLEETDPEKHNKLLSNNAFSPVLVRKIFTRELDYSCLISTSIGTDGFPVIKVPYLKILRYELKSQILAIFTSKSFSDYNLPYFFFLSPICIFIIKNWS